MLKIKFNLLNNTSITSDQCSFGNLPDIPIVDIQLCLPNTKKILLEGFEKYLVLKTEYQFVNKKSKNLFDTLNILAKKGDEVCQVSVHRKGKIFQCKNKWGEEWRPLVIKTLPQRDPTEKKRFEIVYSKPLKTNHNDWHNGMWCPSAKVSIKD